MGGRRFSRGCCLLGKPKASGKCNPHPRRPFTQLPQAVDHVVILRVSFSVRDDSVLAPFRRGWLLEKLPAAGQSTRHAPPSPSPAPPPALHFSHLLSQLLSGRSQLGAAVAVVWHRLALHAGHSGARGAALVGVAGLGSGATCTALLVLHRIVPVVLVRTLLLQLW